MMTWYRLSFRTDVVPSGWVQGVAQECAMRVQREIPSDGFARRRVVTDHLPLEMVADHVARYGMPSAELVFVDIMRMDEMFLEWVQQQMRKAPALGEIVIALFNDHARLGGGERWLGWACYDHAVVAHLAMVTAMEVQKRPGMGAMVTNLTVAVQELHRSEYPSPLVLPRKSLSQQALDDITHEED